MYYSVCSSSYIQNTPNCHWIINKYDQISIMLYNRKLLGEMMAQIWQFWSESSTADVKSIELGTVAKTTVYFRLEETLNSFPAVKSVLMWCRGGMMRHWVNCVMGHLSMGLKMSSDVLVLEVVEVVLSFGSHSCLKLIWLGLIVLEVLAHRFPY